MKLPPMNVGNLRTKDAIWSFIFNCKTNNIDIACIQETHNERNDNHTYGDYSIFYSASGKAINNINNNYNRWADNWRGGLAIIIKNNYVGNIKQIE